MYAGHELAHTIKKTDKKLYDKLKKVLKDNLKAYPLIMQSVYKRGYAAMGKEQGLSDVEIWENLEEEAVANIMGDLFQDKKFWDMVNGKDRSLGGKLIDAFFRFLDSLGEKISGSTKKNFNTRSALDNIDGIRKGFAEVIRESKNAKRFKKSQGYAEAFNEADTTTQAQPEPAQQQETATQMDLFSVDPRTDAEYLRLAKKPKKNLKALQNLVTKTAKAAGYNLGPLYHGTSKAFKEFAYDAIGKIGTKLGPGFYFTNRKKEAIDYSRGTDLKSFDERQADQDKAKKSGYKGASQVLPVSLNIKNAVESDLIGSNLSKDKILPVVERAANLELQDKLKSNPNSVIGDTFISKFEDADKAAEILSNEDTLADQLNAMQKSGIKPQYLLPAFVQETGIDGLTNLNGSVTVALLPEQIKLTDPITRDDQGNVIPLSERFKPESKDIRFALDPDQEARDVADEEATQRQSAEEQRREVEAEAGIRRPIRRGEFGNVRQRIGEYGTQEPGPGSFALDPNEEGATTGININDSTQPFTNQILTGKKTIETRDTNSLKGQVGKRVGIVRTGKGPAKVVGYATIGEPIVYKNEKAFRKDVTKHRVAKGSPFDIKDTKYGYPLIDVKRERKPFEPKGKGIVSRQMFALDPEDSEFYSPLYKVFQDKFPGKASEDQARAFSSQVKLLE